MGSDDPQMVDARPIHQVAVGGFWMDVTEVTNAQFAAFVKATGYVTVAERTPTAEQYPGAPPENLVAGSIVFAPPGHPVPLDSHFAGGVDRAARAGGIRRVVAPTSRRASSIPSCTSPSRMSRRTRAGPASVCRPRRNGSLPREAGHRQRYVWGSTFHPDGHQMANTFQGQFPHTNSAADGHRATRRSGAFRPMASVSTTWPATPGNGWPTGTGPTVPRGGTCHVVGNPAGPPREASHDPDEPGVVKRVMRGGSFLCTDEYCTRYQPGARGRARRTPAPITSASGSSVRRSRRSAEAA